MVDPTIHHGSDQIFFGATVKYETQNGTEHEITIVGVDEFDPLRGKISWVSPVARALNKAHEGDSISLQTPAGIEEIVILEVSYPAPAH